MKPRHIPNILTVLRFILVCPILLSILHERYTPALYFFILAGVTDGLDGLLARIYNWSSYFGSIADPLADKLLLTGCFITLAWVGQLPTWLTVLVIARDVWIVLGALGYRYFIGKLEFKPTGISKINTFLQILLVTMTLANLSFISLPSLLLNTVIYAVLTTTLITFIHYTWEWSERAIRNYRANKTPRTQNVRG